jgi:hypothetical protein
MRIPRRQLAVLVALGAALSVFGPVAEAPLAGAVAPTTTPPAAPVAAGTLVICTGTLGLYFETSTLPGATDLTEISGGVTCLSPAGQSFTAELGGYGYSGTDGLRQCLGDIWLPGPFPGVRGQGFPIDISPGTGNPLYLPNWDVTWAAPPSLQGIPNLPVIGTPSPVTTGLLYSSTGAQLGSATAVWAPDSLQTCNISSNSSQTSVTGFIVMTFTAPPATAFTPTPPPAG